MIDPHNPQDPYRQAIADPRTFSPPKGAFGPGTWLALAALVVVGAGLFFAAHRFAQGELAYFNPQTSKAILWGVRPADGSENVSPLSPVQISVVLSSDPRDQSRSVSLDPATLSEKSVRIMRDDNDTPVAGRLNLGIAGDSVAFTPARPFEAGVKYRVQLTADLKDLVGRSMTVPQRTPTFTVSRDVVPTTHIDAAFERVPLPVEPAWYVALAVGPDGRLYAGTYDGRIVRFDVGSDGTLSSPRTITTILTRNGGPRTIGGIAFDPNSTNAAPRLWVTHAQYHPFTPDAGPADDSTGTLTLLTGSDLQDAHDYVIHLPRSSKEHYPFKPTIGADDAVYWCQPSHTSLGAPDRAWDRRSEGPLTACVLRFDPKLVPTDAAAIDAITVGESNPALTVFATGVRSARSLVLHRNGGLYAVIAGAPAGGNVPGRVGTKTLSKLNPAFYLKNPTDDTINLIERGQYYGHPNPTRGEIILNGGNPTPGNASGGDPYGVIDYPDLTMPEPNWRMPLASLGRAGEPAGMIEYRMTGSALDGALLVCRYGAGKDIVVLTLDEKRDVRQLLVGIDGLRDLADPIDLVQDPRTGALYVAELADSRITLLRPKAGGSTASLDSGRPRTD
ncbi:MAG: Ig-like domain-containing protein [Tepidisphaeraceae bacterium]